MTPPCGRVFPSNLLAVPIGLSRLGRLDVRGGRTLRALLQRELYFLAFGQRLETTSLNGGMMHEHILAAIRRGDEAEALGVVEPLHCSCNHGNSSIWLNCDGMQFILGSLIAGVTTREKWRGFRTDYKKCTATSLTIHRSLLKASIFSVFG